MTKPALDAAYINSLDFLGAVLRLRELPSDRYRSLAFHASCFWDDEKMAEHLDRIPREVPADTTPTIKTSPVLTVVK